jgi:hypothetical protein
MPFQNMYDGDIADQNIKARYEKDQ